MSSQVTPCSFRRRARGIMLAERSALQLKSKGCVGSGQFGEVTAFRRRVQCLHWACPCKLESSPVSVDSSPSLSEMLVLQNHSWMGRSQGG